MNQIPALRHVNFSWAMCAIAMLLKLCTRLPGYVGTVVQCFQEGRVSQQLTSPAAEALDLRGDFGFRCETW